MLKRNPRRTKAEWSAVIAKYQGGSDTVDEFCQREGITTVTFSKWRRRFETDKAEVQTVRKPAPNGFVSVQSAPPPSLNGAAVISLQLGPHDVCQDSCSFF